MLADPARLVAALGLPPGTAVEVEPLTQASDAPERVTLRPPGGAAVVVTVRRSADADRASTNVDAIQALSAVGAAGVAKLLAVVDGATVEGVVEGLTALAVVPPAGACAAAIDAFAGLHAVGIRAGLHWGSCPAEQFPPEELPLHRLGFAAHEREAAREPFAALREALIASPFGFCHGEATAANVLLAPHAATLVAFEAAGFGPQLFDVAAFLLTAGLDALARRDLALRYAAARGLEWEATADVVDLLGIRWGIQELLSLPRRLILAFGDDPVVAAERLAARRVDEGIRTPAGGHPVAAAIRAALWLA